MVRFQTQRQAERCGGGAEERCVGGDDEIRGPLFLREADAAVGSDAGRLSRRDDDAG
jgi:hypothetical protein